MPIAPLGHNNLSRISQQITLSAIDGATALLLSGEEGLDFVLWDSAIEAYRIDESGRIHLADDVVQKSLQRTITSVAPLLDSSQQ